MLFVDDALDRLLNLINAITFLDKLSKCFVSVTHFKKITGDRMFLGI